MSPENSASFGTLCELGQSALCAGAFAGFLVPPGFVAARLFLPRMAERSPAEQFCWSVVLSLPLATVMTELLGRYLAQGAVIGWFAALAVVGVLLLTLQPAGTRLPEDQRAADAPRWTWLFAAAAVGSATILLLCLVDVQRGHHLFVPTVIADWAVRVPLVRAAMAGHVPPSNPLSALDSSPTPLRYYYFWYVLCSYPAHLTHVSAKAALSASSVWAWSGLLATTCLALKYLLGVPQRKFALLGLLPLAAIGLDLLPTLVIVLGGHGHQHMDLEWWRNDRTPGFLTTVLFAPHHIAGLATCVTALAIFGFCQRDVEGNVPLPLLREKADGRVLQPSWRTLASAAVLVGIAFAACAGTSTFMAFVFGLVGLAWAADTLWQRQFRYTAALMGATVLAWLLSRPFLAELRNGNSAAKGFAALAWRYDGFVRLFADRLHVFAAHPVLSFVVRQPAILLLDFAELGFFAFVLFDRARLELLPALKGRRGLTLGERLLWITLLVAGAAALCLSSSVTQAPNDLGMHAGMIVRFVLVLWSVPWLQGRWRGRHTLRELAWPGKLALGSALACLLCGLLGTAWNLGLVRLYLPLAERGSIRGPMDMMRPDALSERMFEIQSAWDSLSLLPSGARVQFNPSGAMQPALAYFSTRQIVASDSGCGTSFGGNYTECAPVSAALHRLYGTEAAVEMVKSLPVYRSASYAATATDFAEVCRSLRLSAVIAESSDHAWDQRTSWVWTLPPVYAGDTVRVYSCPPPM